MATYSPPPQDPGAIELRRRSSVSFDTSNTPELATWLHDHGYQSIPIRSEFEYMRLKRGSTLIILYASGAVLCQGAGAAAAQALLAELEVC